jgi:hypothetical protein
MRGHSPMPLRGANVYESGRATGEEARERTGLPRGEMRRPTCCRGFCLLAVDGRDPGGAQRRAERLGGLFCQLRRGRRGKIEI